MAQQRGLAWLGGGLLRTFHQPGDFMLCTRIGRFMQRVPIEMEQTSLPEFLNRLEHRGGLKSDDVSASTARIVRLRQAWLNLDRFASRNTCYIRALTLFRFLAPSAGGLRIHFGVNPGDNPGDRVHGHAWVSWNGQVLEAPEPVERGIVEELYTFPTE
jgi:hypothetical protein